MKKVLSFTAIFSLFVTAIKGQNKVTNNYEPLKTTTANWYQNAPKLGQIYRADYHFQIKNDTVWVDGMTALPILSEKKTRNVRILFCENGHILTFYTDKKNKVHRVEWANKRILWTFQNGERSIQD